jgi:hypothetical protein
MHGASITRHREQFYHGLVNMIEVGCCASKPYRMISRGRS